MDDRDDHRILHITIDGMDQVIGLLKGNSQALNAVLIGQQQILDAIDNPEKLAGLSAKLKQSADALKAAVDSNQPPK